MTNQIDALKLALEYLKQRDLAWNVQIALKEALAAPVQEPVAVMQQALEVIAVGDSKNPSKDACDVLVELGIWEQSDPPAAEPAPVEPVACVACEGNPKWGNIPCAVCGTTPPAQPAPVQPVAWPMEEQPDGSIIPVDPSELPSDYFTTPPAQPAPVQEPVAVIGSGFQLLYCREDWAKGLKIGDTLCLCTPPAAQPAPVQPTSCWVCCGAGVEFDDTNKTTPCPNCSEAATTTPPAAQPAPVQEPVAYLFTNVQSGDIEASTNPDHKEGEREMWYREPLVRPPAAQPAVPDALFRHAPEHPQYIEGWNDCRAEMLKGRK